MSSNKDGGAETESKQNILMGGQDRKYTSFPGTKYILPSDETERTRLQLQHEAVKRSCNGKFLPSDLSLSDGDSILDSGTGTGAWPIDVVPLISPGVSIVGIDIESRLFPPDPPKNVSFAVHSALSLPADWSETYTFVHQRFLIAAFGLADWQRALPELYRVLKPGGTIMIEEVGSWTEEQLNELPATLPATRHLIFVQHKVFGARGLLWDCASRMVALLREAGFEDVRAEDKGILVGPGEAYAQARSIFIRGANEMKPGVLRLGLAASEEEWSGYIRQLEVEWAANAFSVSFWRFTGRKPSYKA